MQNIPIDVPPEGTEIELGDYLIRQLTNINGAIDSSQTFTPRFNLPNKPKLGLVVYFGQEILPNITGEGLWLYTSTGWIAIATV